MMRLNLAQSGMFMVTLWYNIMIYCSTLLCYITVYYLYYVMLEYNYITQLRYLLVIKCH